MKEKVVKRTVKLLPNYCKRIGLFLIVAAVVIFLLQTQLDHFLTHDEDYSIAGTLLLTGLALLNFSKEKVEDERIRKIRYKTLSYSFMTLVGFVIFGRILNQLIGFDFTYYSSSSAVLFTILLLNLAYFEANKEFDDAEE